MELTLQLYNNGTRRKILVATALPIALLRIERIYSEKTLLLLVAWSFVNPTIKILGYRCFDVYLNETL